MTDSNNRVLLVTELFPPALGGSATLFGEIYSRFGGTPVAVMTKGLAMRQWGIRSPCTFWRYLRAGVALRIASCRAAMIHCGRALPEGVAALLGRCFGGPRYACWAHGEDISTALTSRELTAMMRAVYRNAEVVFANSQSTRRMLVDVGMSADRVHVVYPGVDPARFHPDVDGSEIRRSIAGTDVPTVLLSVGRLQTRKGHDLAIKALAHLVQRGYRSLHYVIVGDGPERARLETLVDEYRVRDHVRFVGEVPAALLPRYYAASDIFLLPNRIEQTDLEGFGIVFLEAAAAGKPAIGGRSGGVSEALVHDVTGILVNGTDVEELVAAIERLTTSAPLRHALGAAARLRVMREFTWERAAESVAALHNRVALQTQAQ
jgi:phosphatidylinositol alpha-1,6-mannosyltransferase